MHDNDQLQPPNSERERRDEHLGRLMRLLERHSDIEALGRHLLLELAALLPIARAALYRVEPLESGEPRLRVAASYSAQGDTPFASPEAKSLALRCALEKRKCAAVDAGTELSAEQLQVGARAPLQLMLLPVMSSGQPEAVLELASTQALDAVDERFLTRLIPPLADVLRRNFPGPPRQAASSSACALAGVEQGAAREVSRYKPELFARMSHELRTPLNSLLVLSKMLAENADKNLTAKQTAFAQAIHASGNELLSLINEILELAKIESSSLRIEPAEVTIEHLREHIEQTFRHTAAEKGVAFRIDLQGALPRAIVTDPRRLRQVLKSLLSNALKFAEQGSVSLSVSPARHGWSREREALNRADAVLAFAVSHTASYGERSGFTDAFSDVPLGASQRGGARLDCILSREMVRLLGGELCAQHAPGVENTVTVYLPAAYPLAGSAELTTPAAPLSEAVAEGVPGCVVSHARQAARVSAEADPSSVTAGDDRVALMVHGAAELHEAVARSEAARAYRPLAARDIVSELAAPVSSLPGAVLLDLRLPHLEGWIALDRLRQDPATRHIPVAALVSSERRLEARQMGAAALLEQPSAASVDVALGELSFYAPERPRRVLVLQLAAALGESDMVKLISAEGIELRVTHSPEEGLAALRAERFHCTVLNLGAADPRQLAALWELPEGKLGPLIVYAPRSLESVGLQQLRARAVALDRAASVERLLHLLSVYLHCSEAAFSRPQGALLAKAARHAPELSGMRVLLVEADVRSLFAMTSALERHGVVVSIADNLESGLLAIEREPGTGALLADAGLSLTNDAELLRRARARQPALPFIVLASDPRPDEKERCMGAGASYYAAKPIDARHLVSVLRVMSVLRAEGGLPVCR